MVLTVFLLFLPQGRRADVELVPGLGAPGHATAVNRGGHAVWEVLTGYIRGTTLIAAVDAIGIGAGMLVLGVPLTASLTCLVFLGAYVPIVGAFVSGALATGITLVTLGPTQALVLLGVVVVVQQVEGNLLQPLVMGHTLQLHAVTTVVSVTIGALVGGVLGALVAVPLVAAAYRLMIQAREDERP
jgi:predicted PurR-regulated permease PerM